MSVSSKSSGSQAATGSEDTLTTQTDAGVYVLCVDLNAMASGDALTVRIKTKDKSAGTSRLAYIAHYFHAQTLLHVYSVPVPIDTEIVCTIEQTDGTNRTYDWNLLIVA